jgi:cyclase
MKQLWMLLGTVGSLFAFEYGLEPVKVSEKIYCFFGAPEAMDTRNNGNMVNSCFIDMDEGWVVIDSGPTYAYASEAYTAARHLRKIPVRYVINTHLHDDHWLGNGFYKENGATILGSEHFGEEVDPKRPTRMQNRITAEAYAKTVPVLPDQMVEGETVLQMKGGEVKVLPVALKAHTESDLVVSIPVLNAVFAGDIVFNGRLPSLRDGDINGWIAVLERIAAMKPKIIVGGHGRDTSSHALDFTLGYLKTLKAEVKKALERGEEIDEAVETITMPEYRQAKMYRVLHRQNVEVAYRTLEWENE